MRWLDMVLRGVPRDPPQDGQAATRRPRRWRRGRRARCTTGSADARWRGAPGGGPHGRRRPRRDRRTHGCPSSFRYAWPSCVEQLPRAGRDRVRRGSGGSRPSAPTTTSGGERREQPGTRRLDLREAQVAQPLHRPVDLRGRDGPFTAERGRVRDAAHHQRHQRLPLVLREAQSAKTGRPSVRMPTFYSRE